jgi:hypothetical protein
MGRECSTHGSVEDCIQSLSTKTLWNDTIIGNNNMAEARTCEAGIAEATLTMRPWKR